MKVEPIRNLEDIARMEDLLRRYGYREWLAFKLGINSALRMGDLLKLRVIHVRERYLTLNESKTRKFKRFYINDSLRPILQDYTRFMSDNDYLFRPIYDNRPPVVKTLYRRMRTTGKMIGLQHIGSHSCRKTFAYHHYRNNRDIAILMELLNHSSERETLIYIGVMQDEMDASLQRHFL